jgi:hypothetical protein
MPILFFGLVSPPGSQCPRKTARKYRVGAMQDQLEINGVGYDGKSVPK